MVRVDLNSDLGESFGNYTLGCDAEVLKYVTSANIACGFHAGDPTVMRKTIKLALASGTALGAHPGLPDLQGFGRRNMAITPQEAYDITVYQIGALYAFAKAEGACLQHVKAHGALYNMAAKDKKLAEALAEAVYAVNPEMILFGLAGSAMITAAEKLGLKTASEVFADRSYQKDGSLTPRNMAGAMITEDSAALAQVMKMVLNGRVTTLAGEEIILKADTICVHGDGAKAIEFTKKIRSSLLESGVEVQNFFVY
jgi:5-oxoprolinase (ATP-hydrolysing) subunit A